MANNLLQGYSNIKRLSPQGNICKKIATTPHPSSANAGLLVVLTMQWAKPPFYSDFCLFLNTRFRCSQRTPCSPSLRILADFFRSCANRSRDPACREPVTLRTETQSDLQVQCTIYHLACQHYFVCFPPYFVFTLLFSTSVVTVRCLSEKGDWP